jgi:CheY-like chemotaxis protein
MIFLTGDIMSPDATRFLEQTDVPCLNKPFTLEMIRQAVHRVLAAVGERALSQHHGRV